MIEFKKNIFKKQVSDILTRFHDSRPFQQGKCTVFDQESDFQVKNNQILHPEAKIKEPTILEKLFFQVLGFSNPFN